MDNYLDNTIQIELGGSTGNVSDILAKAKEDKIRLDTLFDRVMQDSAFFRSEFVDSLPLTMVSSSDIFMNFRSLKLSFEDYYRRSNEISVMLDAESATLISEISSLEKQIKRIEKAISNHAFLLADGGAYDYGYIETFSDNTGRDNIESMGIPDRTGTPFTSSEEATVDTLSGTLVMPVSSKLGRAYIPRIVSDNFRPYVSSSIGISNIRSTDEGQIWRESINSYVPITSALKDFTDKGIANTAGAKAVIDLDLDSASVIDNLFITPLADSPITISQITIFGKEDSDLKVDLLSNDLNAEAVVAISFSPIVASRIRFYISQNKYSRNLTVPDSNEEYYKKNYVARRLDSRKQSQTYKISEEAKGMYRLFVKNTIRNAKGLDKLPVSSHTSTAREFSWGPMNPLKDRTRNAGHITNYPRWFDKNHFDDISKNMHRYRAIGDEINPIDSPRINQTTRRRTPNYSYMDTDVAIKSTVQNSFNAFSNARNFPSYSSMSTGRRSTGVRGGYKYVIGLSSVVVGVDKPSPRGVFVSKQLSPDGFIGEVLLRDLRYDGHAYMDTLLDNNITSSVEYSITNNASPIREEDWKPILPFNRDTVEGEFLVLGDKGIAKFRFPANSQADISIYRNGKKIPINDSEFIYSKNHQSIYGVNLNSVMVSSDDLYTVSYTPDMESKAITFDTENIPLSTAFDQNGAGEGFDTFIGSTRVKLSHEPYLDYVEVGKSTYSSTLGMSPYQPITITFADGTNAINLTNYIDGEQSVLDSNSESYFFIHRDKEIVFNKPVTSNFRVYYKYLANNTRVRVVLRANILGEFSTPRIDYFQLKAKTIKPNAKGLL